jgi:hypothetical protein
VGTDAPENQLHISSSGSNFATIRLDAPENTTPARWQLRSHDGVFDIRDLQSTATRMTIDATGDATFSGSVKVDHIESGTRMLWLNAATNDTATYRQALGVQHSGTDMLAIATGPIVSISSKANQLKLENNKGNLVIDNNGDATFSGALVADGYTAENQLRIRRSSNISGSGAGISLGTTYDNTGVILYGTDEQVFVVSGAGDITTNNPSSSPGYEQYMRIGTLGATFFGTVSAPNITRNGSPVIDAKGLINTLTTLRKATMDETQDIRESLRDAIDELVEGFEQEIATMPAEDSE